MTEHEHDNSARPRTIVPRKLGACPKCMRLSLVLAIASWVAVAATAAALDSDLLVTVTLVIACALSVLFAAHLVAFFAKTLRWWRTQDKTAGAGLAEDESGTRRRFLTVSGMLLGGALFAPLIRSLGGGALAQQSVTRVNCQEGPHWQVNLTTPPIVGCGAAGQNTTPGENALRDFLDKIQAACKAAEPKEGKKGICEQRSCKKVVERCVVRRPAGAEFNNEDLVLREKQAGDPCGAAATHVLFVNKKKNGKDVAFKCTCDCVQ
jgi:hypothetical protein